MDIWALPIRANEGKVTGEVQRLTSTVIDKTYASISRDGTTLVFSADRQRNQDIFLKDLRTGTETALTTTNVNEFSGLPSLDNSKVLYYDFRPDRKPSFSFWVVSATGGIPRQVCTDCDGPLYGWSNDTTKVLWHDQSGNRPGRVRIRNIESGRDDVLVEHEKYEITAPHLSPDERWILFQTVVNQTQRQIFVAPLSGWRAAPESTWIPITNGSTPPIAMRSGRLTATCCTFSPNETDFRGFWAQRSDAVTKRPQGEPFAVQHLHQARRSFDSHDFVGLHLSVGPETLDFTNRERTGNIWLASLEAR